MKLWFFFIYLHKLMSQLSGLLVQFKEVRRYLANLLALYFPVCLQYLKGDFWGFVYFLHTIINTASSAALRFHCADGCWDRTQDCCDWYIGSQTL